MNHRNKRSRTRRQEQLPSKYWWRGMAKTNYRKLPKKAQPKGIE